MKGRSDLANASLAAVVSCALIAAAAGAGLRVPSQETLLGIAGSSSLDYARSVARLAPLSSDFVSTRLGLDPRATSSPVAGPDASLAGDHAPLPGDEVTRTVVKHALTNDEFADAYEVDSIPFTAKTDTTHASRTSDPSECAPVGNTVWYRYTARRDEGLIASTIGTKHATALAVFTGTDPAHLALVAGACHQSLDGNAYVTLPADRGATYFVQVTDVAGGGALVFNLDPAGTTELVSVSLRNESGNSSSGYAVISSGGRYVAFDSAADDLVFGDTNGYEDVFVRDLVTQTTELVSVSSEGEQGRGESRPWPPAISADGRFVAFTSEAPNLVRRDTNGVRDVFVRDRVKRTTTRVSVSSSGREGQAPVDPAEVALDQLRNEDDTGSWGGVSISADGRYVAFDTDLTGLVPGDEAGSETEAGFAGRDVFVHDMRTGRTRLVSRSSEGANANGLSLYPDISADGRYVAFGSAATNLIDGLTPPASPGSPNDPALRGLTDLDIYVHDLATGATELVSIARNGDRANGQSFPPAISHDGRYVAFASVASDLVKGDTNGGMDVFLRDRLKGRIERVSLSSTGEQQDAGESVERTKANAPKPDLSWDARYVVFHSPAPNLVPRDTNSDPNSENAKCGAAGEDVFLRDRRARTTTRVSVTSAGREANSGSGEPSISGDGRRIVFGSWASNLDPRDHPSVAEPAACYHSADSFLHVLPVLH